MHIHILGICGTFMGGLALLARSAGHRVTGCDANVYPPMSTQLEAQGITLIEGFSADQISLKPDLFVIGNVVSRGNPLMEAILNTQQRYTSGPQWLSENILHDKWVLAVAGTHGKTTTSSMLAWILEYAGYEPSFLIGGVPFNFGVSARLNHAPFFVIEADEYDTAFFDKRSKFVHYRPKTAILNNLEFDHADIFPDVSAIETQFHHLVRTIPSIGRVIANAEEDTIQRVLDRGLWSEWEWLSTSQAKPDKAGWNTLPSESGLFDFQVQFHNVVKGMVHWQIQGQHNQHNALAAIAAARHVGVPVSVACEALAQFQNVKRRMELRGEIRGIKVYDDFAHHPTAIETTLAGLRKQVGREQRILAVLEPRSNTMKLGVMKAALPRSLEEADYVFAYGAVEGKSSLGWNLAEALSPLGEKACAFHDLHELVAAVSGMAVSGDQILVMSNGGFGGVHEKLLQALSS